MKSVFLCGVVLSFAAGCGDQARVAALDSRVEALEKSTKLRQAAEQDRFVALPTDQKGFQTVRVIPGQLFVSVEDVSPYLDGFKLHLSVGNPQSMTYSGCKLHLRWAGKTKTEDFTEELRAGWWNHLEIIVTPASVDEIRGLQIAIDTAAIAGTEIVPAAKRP